MTVCRSWGAWRRYLESNHTQVGPPVHEVLRPADEPSVIAAGAELVARLGRLGERLAKKSDPLAGPETVFIGQIHSGEIYNQYPQECFSKAPAAGCREPDGQHVESAFREPWPAWNATTKTSVHAAFV